MSDVIVRVVHLRSVPSYTRRRGFCMSGCRAWWAAHGLDWQHFLEHGIAASVLEATGDPLALRVVKHARSGGG